MDLEIANSGKPIEFTVDTWLGSPGETGYEDNDLENGTLFDAFNANIAPITDSVTPVRGDTVEAAARFADGSVDFLYVDASHTYEGVMRDLDAWFPKVRTGGTIAGDDWCNEQGGELGVRHAAIDFFGRHASAIEVLPGSEPNRDWLQWAIVKTGEMQPTGRLERSLRAIYRRLRRAPKNLRAALRRRI